VQRQAREYHASSIDGKGRADILAMELGVRHASPRPDNGGGREIDGDDAMTGAGEHFGIAPAAATDFEDRPATCALADQRQPAF
jgi:hypothetical protein